ncbi:hypothetical protein [Kibdelosporangium philippinense]
MVDTAFRNGGHGVTERWTRPSGTVDTALTSQARSFPQTAAPFRQ